MSLCSFVWVVTSPCVGNGCCNWGSTSFAGMHFLAGPPIFVRIRELEQREAKHPDLCSESTLVWLAISG